MKSTKWEKKALSMTACDDTAKTPVLLLPPG